MKMMRMMMAVVAEICPAAVVALSPAMATVLVLAMDGWGGRGYHPWIESYPRAVFLATWMAWTAIVWLSGRVMRMIRRLDRNMNLNA